MYSSQLFIRYLNLLDSRHHFDRVALPFGVFIGEYSHYDIHTNSYWHTSFFSRNTLSFDTL